MKWLVWICAPALVGNVAFAQTQGDARPALSAATAPKQKTVVPSAAPTVATRLFAADRCLGDPKFLERLGMSRRAVVDTTQAMPVGMMVVDIDANGKPGRRVQHETWSQAGYLGAVQRDVDGNVFVYPAPNFTIEKNPPEKSNILYRVDSFTGAMTPFAELEKFAPANSQNPYGILATTYDCTTRKLYVASVFGSTPGVAHGSIAMIDTATGASKAVISSFDPFSVVVAHFPKERRLLYAAAREPVVLSRAIRDDGTLIDDERVEIQLDEWNDLGDRKARRLRIDPRGRLLVRVQPFDFTLSASSSIARAELVFDYDVKSGRFKFLSAKETPTAAVHH